MLRLNLHPEDPQPRLIRHLAGLLEADGLVALPSDTGYLLAMSLGAREPLARLSRLRALPDRHPLSLLCLDLKQASRWALFDDRAFRLIRARIPGPYTFIVPASPALPKRLADARKRTVGVRFPAHPVARLLLQTQAEALLVSSLLLPGVEEDEVLEVDELADRVDGSVDAFVDAGPCLSRPSTVVDLSGREITVLRAGAGPVDFL